MTATGPTEDSFVHTVYCRGNCVVDDTAWSMLWWEFASMGFDSPDVAVRKTAVRRLDRIRNYESGIAALAQALVDSDHEVRTEAAIILDSVRAAQAVTGWISLLGDADPSLRERAAITLGIIGDGRAIDALTAALADPEPVVRKQAVRALRNIAWGDEG